MVSRIIRLNNENYNETNAANFHQRNARLDITGLEMKPTGNCARDTVLATSTCTVLSFSKKVIRFLSFSLFNDISIFEDYLVILLEEQQCNYLNHS